MLTLHRLIRKPTLENNGQVVQKGAKVGKEPDPSLPWVRLLAAIPWVMVAYQSARTLAYPTSAHDAGAWLAALAFLVALPAAVWRPRPISILMIGLAAVVMELLGVSGPAFIAAITTIALAGSRLETTPGRTIAEVVGLGYLVATATMSHDLSAGVLLSPFVTLLVTYVATASVRRLRQEKARAEALLHEVLANRDAQVRAAALDERTRLAREIHDVLAHTLAALSIQLEGARMVVEQRAPDPAAIAAVERAHQLAREGLDETRRAVGALRGDSLPGPDLLPQLAADFERDTGTRCRLVVEGEPRDLSSETRLALYRVAQEALTNIRKHAEAATVELRLRYCTGGTELLVEDHSVQRASPIEGGGYGLTGMRERTELLGGRLEAGPTETGFRVCMWIPA